MNPIERATGRWQRFREIAERTASDAKRHAEALLAEVDDLDDAPELYAALQGRVDQAAAAYERHRVIVDHVLPEIERARSRAWRPPLPGTRR